MASRPAALADRDRLPERPELVVSQRGAELLQPVDGVVD
jgi:hypothetical protein